jgi:hypothetical protein
MKFGRALALILAAAFLALIPTRALHADEHHRLGDWDDHHHWHDADWWHEYHPQWIWEHHPEWARHYPAWYRSDGDWDDHHHWHDRDWWYEHDAAWVNKHHPQWHPWGGEYGPHGHEGGHGPSHGR